MLNATHVVDNALKLASQRLFECSKGKLLIRHNIVEAPYPMNGKDCNDAFLYGLIPSSSLDKKYIIVHPYNPSCRYIALANTGCGLNPYLCAIWINDPGRVGNVEDLAIVLIHEIGHNLGLTHANIMDELTPMNPVSFYVNPPPCYSFPERVILNWTTDPYRISANAMMSLPMGLETEVVVNGFYIDSGRKGINIRRIVADKTYGKAVALILTSGWTPTKLSVIEDRGSNTRFVFGIQNGMAMLGVSKPAI